MYRYRRPKKKNFFPRAASLVVAALAATAWHAPKSSPASDIREFSEGLSIRIDRESPAFAALEDTISGFETEMDDLSPYTPMEFIAADETSFAPRARSILAMNRAIEERNENGLRPVLANTRVAASAAPIGADTPVESSQPIAPQKSGATAFAASPVPAPSPEANDAVGAIVAAPGSSLIAGGEVISLDDREQVGAFMKGQAPIEHPSRTIRLADLNVDKAGLLRSLLFPIVASGRQKVGVKAASTRETAVVESPAADRVAGLASRTRPAASERGVDTQAFTEGSAAGDEPLLQLVVSGPIEMMGGLAVTSSSDQVVIYREEQGERFESGHVWLRDGRYEIYVGSVSGRLVGELQTASGDVLGRGDIDLGAMRVGRTQSRADGVKVAIRPLAKGLGGQVISAYSHGTKVEAIAGAKVDLEDIDETLTAARTGKFSDPALGSGSVVVARVTKPGYWGTLAFVEAGAENVVTMFPDSMMAAFRSLAGVEERQPIAVVWGRVVRDGRPVPGATVEMITGERELKPVYFSSLLIPDPSLSSTSANGAYAFVVFESGVHGVQARVGGDGRLDPVLFPVEAGFVTSLDLEVARAKKLDIKVFDAFRTDQPLAARVAPVGSDSLSSIGSSGRGVLRHSPGGGLAAIDIDAGESYAVTRLNLPRERDFAFAPMIGSAWLEGLRSSRRVTKDVDTGVIVGFVDARARYEVHVRPMSAARAVKVLYFDGAGKALRAASGVPGGGYAIFNVPEGIVTVSIVSDGAAKIQAVTALADRGVANVFNHSLR